MAAWWETAFPSSAEGPADDAPWWETAFKPADPNDERDAARFASRYGADNPALKAPPSYEVDRPFQGTVTQTPEDFSRQEYRYAELNQLSNEGAIPESMYANPNLGKMSDDQFETYKTRVAQLNDLTEIVPDDVVRNPLLVGLDDKAWNKYLDKLENRKNAVAGIKEFQESIRGDFQNMRDWTFGRIQQYAGMGKEWGSGVAQMMADSPDNFNPDLDRLAKRWYDEAQLNMKMAGFSRPDNIILQMGTDALDSMPYLASGIIASAASKVPFAGDVAMGLMVAPGEYAGARFKDHKSPTDAYKEMSARTLAEVIPERMFGVFNRAANGIGGVRGLGLQIGGEALSEGTTELGHIALDADETGQTPGFIEGGKRIGYAMSVGGLMGSGSSAVQAPIDYLHQQSQSRDLDRMLGDVAFMHATDLLDPNRAQLRQVEAPSDGVLPDFDAAFGAAAQDIDSVLRGIDDEVQMLQQPPDWSEQLPEMSQPLNWGAPVGTAQARGLSGDSATEVSRETSDETLFDDPLPNEAISSYLDRAVGPNQAGAPIMGGVAPVQAQAAPVRTPKDADNSFIETDFDPLTADVDPIAFQYKSENIDEKGANKTLKDVQRWDNAMAGVMSIWERKDGKRFVADGHQRRAMAERLKDQNPRLIARVYREEDGYTKEFMRVQGALINIAQNTGSVVDAAKIIREVTKAGEIGGITQETLEQVFPKTGAITKYAPGLAKLSDEAFQAVINDVLKPEYASLIGERYADHAEQMAALDALAKAEPETLFQAQNILEQVDDAGIQPSQPDMLGTMAKSYFKERAKLLETVSRRAKNRKSLHDNLIRNETQIQNTGKNRLDRGANQQIVTEQETLLSQLGVLARTDREISNALNIQAKLIGTNQSTLGRSADVIEGAISRFVELGGTAPAREQPGEQSNEDDARSEGGGGLFERSRGVAAGQPGTQDIFGDNTTTEQGIADAQRQKDEKRNGKPGQETVPVEAGNGDLFGGPARSNQGSLFQRTAAGIEIQRTVDQSKPRQGSPVTLFSRSPIQVYSPDPTDLMVVQHNISADKLRHAAKMGGLPMPSIGISKASQPLEGYGDITLIAGPGLINPSASNPVYSADAYTPTYPSITYFLSEANSKKFHAFISEPFGVDRPWKVPESTDKDSRGRYISNLLDDGSFERWGLDGMESSVPVMARYLWENDKMPSIKDHPSRWDWERAVRDAVRDDAAYEAWAASLSDRLGISQEEKLWGGYTYSGKRRWFPNTLENAVKLMKKDMRENQTGMFGAGALRAQVAPTFKTMTSLKKARGRLYSEEAVKDIKQSFNDRLVDISSKIAEYAKYKDSNVFIQHDRVRDQLAEIAARQSRWDEYFNPVPQDLKDEWNNYIKDLVNAPTAYFESKPQRVVELNEFKKALVPENAPDDVVRLLEKQGISVDRYTDTADKARLLMADKSLLFKRSTVAKDTRAENTGKVSTASKRLIKALQPSASKALAEDAILQVESPSELQGQIKAIRRVFGKNVVFFRKNTDDIFGFEGVVIDSNTIYVNESLQNPFTATVFHELLHQLRMNRPDLYRALAESALKATSKERFTAFRGMMNELTDGNQERRLSNDLILEELLADSVADAFLDESFLQQLASENPSKFREIMEAVLEYLNNLMDEIRTKNMGTTKFYRDVQGLRDTMAQVLNEYADGVDSKVSEAPNEGVYSKNHDRKNSQVQDKRSDRAAAADQTSFNLEPAPAVSDQRDQLTDNFNTHYRHVPVGEIKVGTGEGAQAIRFQRTPKGDTFYSALDETVNKAEGMPKKGLPAQFKQWLDGQQRKGNLKQEERDWLGVDEWLDGQQQVTREDLQSFVRENQVEIEETILSKDVKIDWTAEPIKAGLWQVKANGTDVDSVQAESAEDAINEVSLSPNLEELMGDYPDTRPAGRPKFEQYQHPGGKKYRELLLTLPVKQAPKEVFGVIFTGSAWKITKNNEVMNMREFPTQEAAEDTARNYNENDQRVQSEKSAFKSSHYDQPNIIVHVRFSERTDANGKRVLFIEEIQSDWHQKGRKKGYKDDKINGVPFKITGQIHDIVKRNGFLGFDGIGEALTELRKLSPADLDGAFFGGFEFNTEADARTMSEYASAWQTDQKNRLAVPDAPFKPTGSWSMLAMKRMIRWAAENDFDSIAWTTGEQQNERYDLSKKISEIHYSGTSLKAYDHDGKTVISQTGVSENELPDIIGKEATERLLNQPKQGTLRSLVGEELQIGGEGMKGFYDRILPAEVGKYVKKWGAKVGETKIQTSNQPKDSDFGESDELIKTVPAHSIIITDSMRESALAGQPMFQRSAPNTPAFKKWFGESKVVDDRGEPLVVYHGTEKAGFSKFDANMAGKNSGRNLSGLYFTNKILGAQTYSGTRDEAEIVDDQKFDPRYDGEPGNYSVYLSIQNPMEIDFEGRGWEGTSEDGDTDPWYNMDRVVRRAQKAGHDGVIASNVNDEGRYGQGYGWGDKTFVAFKPTQVKSATGNTGTYDPENPDIRYQRSRQPGNFANWTLPNQTLHDAFRDQSMSLFEKMGKGTAMARLEIRQKLQDRMLPMREVIREIRAGKPIQEFMDVYEREALMYGRVGDLFEQMERKLLEPMLQLAAKHGISNADLGEYLYALHAPSRNARIRAKSAYVIGNSGALVPEQDAGSGMTDAEAATIRRKIEQGPKAQAYKDLVGYVRKVTEATRKNYRSYGLVLPEVLDSWDSADAFNETYVPLKGWEESPENLKPGSVGRGFDVRGEDVRRALGRKTKPSDILSNIVADYKSSLIRGEKNSIGQGLYQLVVDNPNPDLWEHGTLKTRKAFDEKTGVVVERIDIGELQRADEVFMLKIDGKAHWVRLKDTRMQRAMKNLGVEQVGPIIRQFAKLNRWLSVANTMYNPEFIISNFSRDLQAAAVRLTAEEMSDIRNKAVAVKAMRQSIAAMFNELRGKRPTTEYQRYAREFKEDGAHTDYFRQMSIEDYARHLDSVLGFYKNSAWGKTKRGGRAIKDMIEDANGAVENGIRLSVYIELRKKGVSRQKAASAAKNLTVNFNRKGELGPVINSLYLFFNAAMQGVHLALTTLKSKPGQKVWAGLAVAGILQTLWNGLMGGEDDDGIAYLDKIPDWERERNWLLIIPPQVIEYLDEKNLPFLNKIMDGKNDSGGRYIKFPLPYVFNIPVTTGDALANTTLFGESPGKAATRTFLAIYNSVNPIGDNSLLGTILPTVLDVPWEISDNKTFFGGPIYREKFPGDNSPDSSDSFHGVAPIWKNMATILNQAGGGDQWRASKYTDVHPETLRHWFNFFTGGAGSFVNRVGENAAAILYGADIQGISGDEPLKPEKLAFFRKLYGKVWDGSASVQYYDRREDLLALESEYNDRKESAKLGGDSAHLFREFKRDNRKELGTGEHKKLTGLCVYTGGGVLADLKGTDCKLKELRKNREELRQREDQTKMVKDRILSIEKQMLKEQNRFNTKWNRLYHDRGWLREAMDDSNG